LNFQVAEQDDMIREFANKQAEFEELTRKYKLLEQENSALAGHSNHQQRIQVLMRCKQERDEARQHVRELRRQLMAATAIIEQHQQQQQQQQQQ
jgi:predicted nuclease with TOPRIM domain